MKNIKEKKKKAIIWFKTLRDQICEVLETIENNNNDVKKKFKKTTWKRESKGLKDTGGGEMKILRGAIFEKAGVNVSTVYGKISKELKGKIPGTEKKSDFWASGISLVIHPKSPMVPSVHMNTRFIVTNNAWFGGGADITPCDKKSVNSIKQADLFHKNFKIICDEYKKGAYLKYKKWCDEYFFIPHRNESRGLGGIFYDYLNSENWEKDFNFTQNVGKTFINTYKEIVSKSISRTWTKKDYELQMLRRSRYVEFNLLYDRGTKFGLLTKGNPDAIFMSLPPLVSW